MFLQLYRRLSRVDGGLVARLARNDVKVPQYLAHHLVLDTQPLRCLVHDDV